MNRAEAYCDGSCAHLTKENWMGMGVYIRFIKDGLITDAGGAAITGPKGTHNEAEYLAVLSTLEALLAVLSHRKIDSIEIHSDSQLIINQINGKFAVKSDRLRHLYNEVLLLCQQIHAKGIIPTFVWVPRTHKYQIKADKLSNVSNPYYTKIYDESKSSSLDRSLTSERYERLHRNLEWGSE